MQESGNPPEEIMKEMGSGLDFLNDAGPGKEGGLPAGLPGGEECNLM